MNFAESDEHEEEAAAEFIDLRKYPPGSLKASFSASVGFMEGPEYVTDLDECIASNFYVDAVGNLTRLSEDLRRRLQALGLPTDQTPSTVRNQVELPTDQIELCIQAEFQNCAIPAWLDQVVRTAPHLSEGELSAKLLFNLCSLLENASLRDHVGLIWRCMHTFANLKVAEVNELAVSGAKAKHARSAGPKARAQKSKKIREIVWEHARRLWDNRPNFRGDASNTALEIADGVRNDLASVGLLSKRGRSAKTIAHDISIGIKAGKL